MIADGHAKGSTVWFIVPRRELARQTANTLESWGVPFSYIMANYAHNPYARVQIVSLQTVMQRYGKLKAPNLAMIDETHVSGASMDVLVAWLKKNGTFILGMSGTPWRLDGQGLGKYYDHMVCGPSVRWLIDNKFLSDFRAFAPSRPDLSDVKTVGGDYDKKQLASKMEDDRVLIGDAVRHYRQNAMGRLNMVYATSRKHSEMIATQFRDAGIPAMHMDGETQDADRRRIIRAFAMRELLVMTTVDIATYGFDLAANAGMDVTVEAMSDLRPTKSLALQLQKFGRVLRRKDYPAIIHDHAGNIREFGLPDTDREWTLASRDRKKAGGDDERTIASRQCSACFFAHRPAPACPNCGHVYPIQSRELDHIEGDLAEVTGLSPEDQAKLQRRKEQGMAKSLNDLIALARARGYAAPEAWAAKIYTARKAGGGG